MNTLGPEGAQQRMQEIQAKIAEFSPKPPAPVAGNEFASRLNGAIGGGFSPLDPTSANLSPTGGASKYGDMAEAAAKKYGLDPNVFKALVQQESGWDPSVVSNKGAVGLTQLMPTTAAQMGIADPADPAQNLDGGAKYLKQMLDKFGSYQNGLAAYNAGPAAVEKAHGVPHYHETIDYVRRILTHAGMLKS